MLLMHLAKSAAGPAVSQLIAALSDKKDSVRGAAAVALGEIGDHNGGCIPGRAVDPQSD